MVPQDDASAVRYASAVRTFQTSLGPVPLWGAFDRFDAARPLLLVIRGFMAGRDDWDAFVHEFPEADVVLGHLPGMHTPFLARNDVRSFGRAYDEAMRAAFPGRTPVVTGLSVGALVALAMRSAKRIVALDPPLATANLWPLRAQILELARARSGPALSWLEGVFGVRNGRLRNISYRPLIDDAAVETTVIIAGQPLAPEREIPQLPGLISDEDRQWLVAHPKVRAIVAEGASHDLPSTAGALVSHEIKRVLQVSS